MEVEEDEVTEVLGFLGVGVGRKKIMLDFFC